MRDMAQREYELRLNFIQHSHGFWRGAPLFRSIALDFQQSKKPHAM